MSKYLITLLLSFVFCLLSSALGGIIQVPQDQPGIQAGINAAFPGDTVLVADSTYYENIDFKGKAIIVASYFLMDGDTTHINNTIIDGSQPSDPNKGSVVSFVSGEDTTSVICGFTITGGSGTFYSPTSAQVGGGVFCNNSGCKAVANKIINNNVTGPAVRGGGFAAIPFGNSANVVLKDNLIAHNIATADTYQSYGGGVYLNCYARIDSNLISYNSSISNAGSGNYKTMGGGIACIQSPYSREIIMENNLITHNTIFNYSSEVSGPAAFGGGVSIMGYNGRMTRNEICLNEIWNHSNKVVGSVGAGVGSCPDSFLIESNIIRNNAYKQGTGDCYGGGLQVFGIGYISVINNLIEGNLATYGSGVVVANNIAYPGKAVFVNNTIVNNTATYGGGLYVHESTAHVMNTIIWGNKATTGAAINTYESRIYVAYSDVQGTWTGAGNINTDPEFIPGDSLYHLSDSSPCINRGIDSLLMGGMMCYCPPDDYEIDDDFLRPYPGTRPDIGADETDVVTEPELVWWQAANIPQEYALDQNYPNPFNPSTTFEFALPISSFVTLKIYNLLGQEVATLLAEKRPVGIHRFNWDASGLASGVYLYRLQAGDPSQKSGQSFVQTRKLILIK